MNKEEQLVLTVEDISAWMEHLFTMKANYERFHEHKAAELTMANIDLLETLLVYDHSRRVET